ncbi:molybdenum cofactor cytidylyltransferase [Aquimarina sp. MAR_2010_214]|uniref:nucleotidyltransferase family protein n=1 Tax=Aquimarina sp. MAR_2010_214 TaxID=1250026 RepID=UPI000C7141FF|nr:nucleotidyltransferase family protein [Aquimarina sp. MAR_2010_214]PKV50896.1 molybdenum cofactor cytidylyltransferase [Aquimarina sp. MAR_2010_214]
MSSLPKPKIAQLILAAGSSSRMGEPKQVLPWSNTTLIGHAIEKALLIKEVPIYVVLGAHYDVIYKEICHFPVTILKNSKWQSGMGSTIRSGIMAIQQNKLSYDGVLVSLVDQPLLDTIHFNSLITQFNKQPGAIAATDLGFGIGVPAIIPSKYFDELLQLKADFGARYIIKKHMDKIYTVDAIGKGADIDTIAQYNAMIKNNFSS